MRATQLGTMILLSIVLAACGDDDSGGAGSGGVGGSAGAGGDAGAAGTSCSATPNCAGNGGSDGGDDAGYDAGQDAALERDASLDDDAGWTPISMCLDGDTRSWAVRIDARTFVITDAWRPLPILGQPSLPFDYSAVCAGNTTQLQPFSCAHNTGVVRVTLPSALEDDSDGLFDASDPDVQVVLERRLYADWDLNLGCRCAPPDESPLRLTRGTLQFERDSAGALIVSVSDIGDADRWTAKSAGIIECWKTPLDAGL